jgi:hypothetical protein
MSSTARLGNSMTPAALALTIAVAVAHSKTPRWDRFR